MAEEIKQQEMTIRDILYIIFKHKILIVTIFTIAIVAVGFINKVLLNQEKVKSIFNK